jgi:hypothetical protein
MNATLATWLQLRERADAAARSADVARAVIEKLGEKLDATESLRVLDLGTGTGSNIRHLAPSLPSPQYWLAVDRDPELLGQLLASMSSWATTSGLELKLSVDGCVVRGEGLECHVESRQLDLNSLPTLDIFEGRRLVTASALLDLVSESWLTALADRCRAISASVLVALTYDGRSHCTPVEPEDEEIRILLNRHQGRDKGLGGPAAGPEAADVAARCFAAAGYRVVRESSDWTLGSGEAELQKHLIEGWADAAEQMVPADAARIARWRNRRIDHVVSGRSTIVVGHTDIGAWLP